MTRALGDEHEAGTPRDLIEGPFSVPIRGLALSAAALCDPIAKKAQAWHDLPNCLVDKTGNLRLDTQLLDAQGNFREPVWQTAAAAIKARLMQQVSDNGHDLSNPDALNNAALTRIIAIHMILNDVPGFADAVIAQDQAYKQQHANQNGTAEASTEGQSWLKRHAAVREAREAASKEDAARGPAAFARPSGGFAERLTPEARAKAQGL